ncbi:uncharacterized protein LOC123552356 [Mercenaria mercenaria]|uniref:uncharacterized protein LOC123552356 n=1 Tax=Mercenaria mercenaria TaxID=6596 RepID=UPI00234F4055|nr:uncharacterized protein LOC123552356 [Mercenaria mercenaria]
MAEHPEEPRRPVRRRIGPYDRAAGFAIFPIRGSDNRLIVRRVIPPRPPRPVSAARQNRRLRHMNNGPVPNNADPNSMAHRIHAERPHPYNMRRRGNKPRHEGLTKSQSQRTRPEDPESLHARRTELQRLIDEVTGKPQPGTSGANGSGGSRDMPPYAQKEGYWRPDLIASTCSSDESLPEIITGPSLLQRQSDSETVVPPNPEPVKDKPYKRKRRKSSGQNDKEAVAFNTRRAVKRRREEENRSREIDEIEGGEEGKGGKRRRC